MGKGTVGILTKQGEINFNPNFSHDEGLKDTFLSIGQLIQKGYIFYMEANHLVIKDKHPRNQLIVKVPMTSNRLFPLRIVPDMKGKTKTRAASKAESEETVKLLEKKENCSTNLQATFQTEVQDEFWLWHFRFGHLNFGGLKLLHKEYGERISIDQQTREGL